MGLVPFQLWCVHFYRLGPPLLLSYILFLRAWCRSNSCLLFLWAWSHSACDRSHAYVLRPVPNLWWVPFQLAWSRSNSMMGHIPILQCVLFLYTWPIPIQWLFLFQWACYHSNSVLGITPMDLVLFRSCNGSCYYTTWFLPVLWQVPFQFNLFIPMGLVSFWFHDGPIPMSFVPFWLSWISFV